jgi:hypothetical protein
MTETEATETVLRIMRELETGRAPIGTPPAATGIEGPATPCGLPTLPAPPGPCAASYPRRKALVPPHGAC